MDLINEEVAVEHLILVLPFSETNDLWMFFSKRVQMLLISDDNCVKS